MIHPVDPKLFFTRNDPNDLRLGDFVTSGIVRDNLKNLILDGDLILWGYPDDEGIQINGGRPGAKEGPFFIRTYFYKMTPDLWGQSFPKILDLGNIDVQFSLEERHKTGQQLSYLATESNKIWATLGGGHDYGYPDAAGFCQSILKQGLKPVVINFDAHLDVRPTDKGFHSGTPFFRLLNEYSDKIHFYEIGIQAQCNSRQHLSWVKSKGAKIIPLDDLIGENAIGIFLNRLKKELSFLKNSPLFISLDIDGFTSNEAPGCSQSWTRGLCLNQFSFGLRWLCENFSVQGLGIYEVSPPLDQDNRTSKLSALILHDFLKMVKK